jgi:TatD DNase family protein
MAESFRGVFATAGMHPHTAGDLDDAAGADIEELLANPQVVGVGECGLDYFRMKSPVEEQQRAFRLHVRWSREVDKPLVVHVRDAWPDVLRVLDEGSAERVVIHCFSGDAKVARECVARGYYLSFAGNVTYPKNDHLRQAARTTPLDRLLVETDSPFLAPQKLRGTDNEPANVTITLRAIAAELGEAYEAVRNATAANAFAIFDGLQ